MKMNIPVQKISGIALFTFLGLASSVTSIAADQAPAPYQISCQAAEALKESADSCEDNELYAEAAVICLEQTENLVKEKSEALKKSLEALRTNSNQQTQKLSEAQKSYATQEEELLRLIETVKTTSDQIKGYANDIVYPEHWDHEESITDYNEFFESEACYAENRETLFEALEDADIMKSELMDTLALARSLKARSTKSGAGLDSLSAPAVKSTTGAGAVDQVKNGKSKNDSSTITGVEEDKKKQAPKK